MQAYHELRKKVPSDVRLAMIALRGRAEKEIILGAESKDPNKLMQICQKYGMVWGNFSFIFTVENHDDGIYGHLSVAHRERYPTWDELVIFRTVFFDDEDEVIQILPRASEYVNVHGRCFHLWHKQDGKVLSL